MNDNGLRFVLDGNFASGAEMVKRVNEFVGSPFQLTPIASSVASDTGKAAIAGAINQTPVAPNAPSLFKHDNAGDDEARPQLPDVNAPQLAKSKDGKGMVPWDERVHSGARSLNADGTWKARKGVLPATVAKVEAELVVSGAVVPAPVAPQSTAPAPVAPQPGLPGLPAPVAPVVIEQAPTDFVSLIRWTAKHTKTPSNPNGKLEQSMIDYICTHYGFGSIQEVSSKPEFVPYIYQYLTETIGEPYLPGHTQIV